MVDIIKTGLCWGQLPIFCGGGLQSVKLSHTYFKHTWRELVEGTDYYVGKCKGERVGQIWLIPMRNEQDFRGVLVPITDWPEVHHHYARMMHDFKRYKNALFQTVLDEISFMTLHACLEIELTYDFEKPSKYVDEI